MKMFSVMEIEEILREIARQKIKSFYIEYFANQLDMDLATAAKLLNDFADQSDKLILKYEIRCEDCIEFITEFDNIEDIEIGMEIDCINCPDESITVSEDNIYIKYHISEEFVKCVNNTRKMKGLGRRRTKSNSTPFSISQLEEQKALNVVYIDSKHISLNYDIDKSFSNFGIAGIMGDNGISRENTFAK